VHHRGVPSQSTTRVLTLSVRRVFTAGNYDEVLHVEPIARNLFERLWGAQAARAGQSDHAAISEVLDRTPLLLATLEHDRLLAASVPPGDPRGIQNGRTAIADSAQVSLHGPKVVLPYPNGGCGHAGPFVMLVPISKGDRFDHDSKTERIGCTLLDWSAGGWRGGGCWECPGGGGLIS